MTRSILYAFKTLKPYEEAEREQAGAIRDFYKIAFAVSVIPAEIDVIEEDGKFFAAHHPNVNNLEFSASMVGLENADGCLKPGVVEVIQIICAYQKQRHERKLFDSGYLDEPIQLLLEQIKKETQALALAGATDGTLTKVDQWINFLDLILKSEIFLPTHPICREGPSKKLPEGSMTFYGVILRAKRHFAEQIQPSLLRKMKSASAREHAAAMVDTCLQLAQGFWSYLVYVLADGKKPVAQDVTIGSLHQPHHAEFLSSHLGKCVAVLASLFDTRRSAAQTNAVAQVMHVNPFRDTDNHLCLPFQVAHPKPGLPSNGLEQLSSKKESGLSSDFCENSLNAGIIRFHFVELYALTAQLLETRNVWELTFELAGLGGDLAVCGLANPDINLFLGGTEVLLQKMQSSLVILHAAAYRHYEEIYMTPRENKAPNWCANFRFSWIFYAALMKDFEKLAMEIGKFREHLNKLSTTDLLRKTQDTLNELKKQVGHCIRDIFSLAGEQHLDSVVVKQFSPVTYANAPSGGSVAAAASSSGLLRAPPSSTNSWTDLSRRQAEQDRQRVVSSPAALPVSVVSASSVDSGNAGERSSLAADASSPNAAGHSGNPSGGAFVTVRTVTNGAAASSNPGDQVESDDDDDEMRRHIEELASYSLRK